MANFSVKATGGAWFDNYQGLRNSHLSVYFNGSITEENAAAGTAKVTLNTIGVASDGYYKAEYPWVLRGTVYYNYKKASGDWNGWIKLGDLLFDNTHGIAMTLNQTNPSTQGYINGSSTWDGNPVGSSFILPYSDSGAATFKFRVGNGGIEDGSLFFYNGTIYGVNMNNHIQWESEEQAASMNRYSAVGKPSSFSVPARSRYGANFDISWSAASGGSNTSVVGYHVIYKTDSGAWATLVDSTTSLSATVSSSSWGQGSTYQFGVKALSNISGYDSDYVYSSVGSVNRLPYAPTVTCSSTSAFSGDTVSFTVKDNGDPDSDSTTIYYSLDGASWSVGSGTLSFVLSSGSHTLKAFARDAYSQDSGAGSASISVTAPSVSSISTTVGDAGALALNGYSITQTFNVKYTLNNSKASPYFYCRSGSSPSSLGAAVYLGASSPTSIGDSATRGNYYQIGVAAHTAAETSGVSWSSSIYIRPQTPSAAVINSLSDANITGSTTYYNNSFAITLTTPTPSASAKQSPLSSVRISYMYNGAENNLDSFGVAAATAYSRTLSPSASIARSGTITVRVILYDINGVSTTSEKTITRAFVPGFISSNISVAYSEGMPFRPYNFTDSQSIIIRLPRVSTAYNDSGAKIRIYTSSKSSGWLEFTPGGGVNQGANTGAYWSVAAENESTNVFTFTKLGTYYKDWYLNTVYPGAASAFDLTFKIDAIDVFGNSTSLQASYSVSYLTAPWFESTTFYAGVDREFKTSGGKGVAKRIFAFENTSGSDEAAQCQIANQGENIVLALPNFGIANPNESLTLWIFRGSSAAEVRSSNSPYKIYTNALSSSDIKLITDWIPDASNKNLKVLKFETDGASYQQYYYGFQLISSGSGYSTERYLADVPIIQSRVSNPTMQLANNNYSISENVISATITDIDYGGNQNNPTYKNYERAIDGFTKQMSIRLVASFSPDFSSLLPLQSDTSDIVYRNGSYQGFTTQSISIKLAETPTRIVYVRAIISVNSGITGSGQKAYTGISSTVILYPIAPTVSRRVNSVGINTNTFDGNEALRIQSYKEKTKVVLGGTVNGDIVASLDTGNLAAMSVTVANGVNLQYNGTTKALEFLFF